MFERMDEVLDRVRLDHGEHLSCRSLDALTAYECGYEYGCLRCGIPVPRSAHGPELLAWLRSQIDATAEHASRLNAFNWLNIAPLARLRAADDAEAYELYFELRTQVAGLPQHPVKRNPIVVELFEMLREIQGRPGMYFGNDFRFLQVWAFCSGFRWAERDANAGDYQAEPLFTSFPPWLEVRYPFARGLPWHRLFSALGLNSADWAFRLFFEHVELFRAGEPPDTEDPTMRKMWANIAAKCAERDGA